MKFSRHLMLALATVCQLASLAWPQTVAAQGPEVKFRLRISFGLQSPNRREHPVKLFSSTEGLLVASITGQDLEPGDSASTVSTLHVGAGDVDTLECEVRWTSSREPKRRPQEIWNYLLQNATSELSQRLREDPGLTPNAPVLTVQLNDEGTRGFSVGLNQLRQQRAMWLPEQDAFITLVDAPVGFDTHLAILRGERVLDRVKHEPDATLADFTSRWEDMGNPVQWNKAWETTWRGTRGHIVPLVGQHGSLYKCCIDRYGNVRPDFASPHKFRFDVIWPDSVWKSQALENGLPVITTELSRRGQTCCVEQFVAAIPSAGESLRGEAPMVLLTQARISGEPGPVKLGFILATQSPRLHPELKQIQGNWCVVDRESGKLWLTIQPGSGLTVAPGTEIVDPGDPRVQFEVTGSLSVGESREVLVTLPSPAPALLSEFANTLAKLDFTGARAATVKYWENWLTQGATFTVPDAKVNELFRANLWHSLRLPRFRTEKDKPWTDLPYSNVAYGQFNADWPINQAVYVDYMVYGLRGHFNIAEEEFAAMFQSQQQPDGRIAGFANWGVYSPSMLYSIAQNYLLSGDRDSFERLLPQSLKAMDWCLGQMAAAENSQEARGLIQLPLNDLTKESRAWAFPQAYFVAGLSLFADALEEYKHPRAGECRTAANKMREAVEREFARGSVKSPVVQLADGTWINYVPCDALTPRRLLDLWYPTDIDTGPLHLSRLKALDPKGWLTTSMLNDHEDNLFLNQWGAANEPVYNQQGTTYLDRDEPEAAIRTFYSTMACAFSHSQYEPVEHRWAWPQYFGPPSTDGAWFELYRNLLIHETDKKTLLLGQATPRAWIMVGKQIKVERAPTYFGPIDFHIESHSAATEILAEAKFLSDRRPETLLVRLRHPGKKPIRSVTVNGQASNDFDPTKEWVRIPSPTSERYEIVTKY